MLIIIGCRPRSPLCRFLDLEQSLEVLAKQNSDLLASLYKYYSLPISMLLEHFRFH